MVVDLSNPIIEISPLHWASLLLVLAFLLLENYLQFCTLFNLFPI